jgi:hypothetical protein
MTRTSATMLARVSGLLALAVILAGCGGGSKPGAKTEAPDWHLG